VAQGRGEVLLAMSGGVDSSLAALMLMEAGYHVTGVTMKLWGGQGDKGCCSVSDVDDARRVADQLGIAHHVFNFGDDFEHHVVAPYVAAHAAGRTPNPCIECNRHLKFDKFLRRASQLGFERVATGHHARVVAQPDGSRRIARGVDAAKDQSYVLAMLGQGVLARLLLPVGELEKADVRRRAAAAGIRTAAKPDSQDVCFVTATGGRQVFLGERLAFTPGRVVDRCGTVVGAVDAVELVTVGQRKGLGLAGGGPPRFVLSASRADATVVVGTHDELLTAVTPIAAPEWSHRPVTGAVLAQTSAHGDAIPATLADGAVHWATPRRRVAPGQTVVFYRDDQVVGCATAVS
jgi:tRNA-specific 2-thiouridylase